MDAAETTEVYECLCGEARLRIFDLDGAGPFSRQDFLRIAADRSRWNFVAHR